MLDDRARHELRDWTRTRGYRKRSAEFLELASNASDPDLQNRYVRSAQYYRTLAEAEERDAEQKGTERRAQRAAIPPSKDRGPPGEADVVAKIRHMCVIAGMSAENVARERAADDYEPLERLTYEQDRYGRFRVEALKLADTLTDEFYRSAAVRFIIDISMRAGDVDDARALLKHVKVDFMRDEIVASYPQLTHQKLSDAIRK